MKAEYKKITELAVSLGKTLPPLAGKIADISQKRQWLTEKDLEIERALTDLIATFGPNHQVFAEEEHSDLREGKENSEHLWVIDPISSTFNFIHGFDHFAVVLSHVYQGQTQFSLIFDPSNNELFVAQKGRGATLNGQLIQPKSAQTQDWSIVCLLAPNYPKKESLGLWSELYDLVGGGGKTKINFGSEALHYAYVACGRADLAVVASKDCFAAFAGQLLVQEAGGQFSLFNGENLNTKNYGFLASKNQSTHEQALQITRKYHF